MGYCRRLGLFVCLAFLVGCQTSQPGIANRLSAHSALIDYSGLSPAITVRELNARASLPHYWISQSPDTGAFYTHEQWRSPSKSTAVGIAAIQLPLPMSAKTLVWFARRQYDKQTSSAMLTEWTDSIGREWFEGENEKYHVRGYVVTNGFKAWVVYAGYRRRSSLKPAELGLALRSIDSIVPMPLTK